MSAQFVSVAVVRFSPDGSATQKIWAAGEERAAEVEQLLGTPTAEQILSSEHLGRAAEQAATTPIIYLGGEPS